MDLDQWVQFMEDADVLRVYTPHDIHGQIQDSFRKSLNPEKLFHHVTARSVDQASSSQSRVAFTVFFQVRACAPKS